MVPSGYYRPGFLVASLVFRNIQTRGERDKEGWKERSGKGAGEAEREKERERERERERASLPNEYLTHRDTFLYSFYLAFHYSVPTLLH